jgi:hypothetical protein
VLNVAAEYTLFLYEQNNECDAVKQKALDDSSHISNTNSKESLTA